MSFVRWIRTKTVTIFKFFYRQCSHIYLSTIRQWFDTTFLRNQCVERLYNRTIDHRTGYEEYNLSIHFITYFFPNFSCALGNGILQKYEVSFFFHNDSWHASVKIPCHKQKEIVLVFRRRQHSRISSCVLSYKVFLVVFC